MSKNLKNLRENRRQEDEEDNYRIAQKSASQARAGAVKQINILSDEKTGKVDFNQKLGELLDRAAPLVEQVNSLYNQYFAGTEQRPPIERRKLLDGLILQLEAIPKPTIQYQFRFNNIQSTYFTYRNRWEKTCKAIESGRIKRPSGPKRAA